MVKASLYTRYAVLWLFALSLFPAIVSAQTIAHTAVRNPLDAEIIFSPRSGTFTEGSSFEIPVLLNTKGNSINVVELNIKFDASKLTLINPSSSKSIIGVWVEQPSYSNTKGTIKFSGIVLGGVVTSSGLITTLTFKAKSTGTANVELLSSSNVFLNDGNGVAFAPTSVRGSYSIIQKAPEGVHVYSETHPLADTWYNNKNPVFTWDNDEHADGFNYDINNIPTTVLDNVVKGTSTVQAYTDMPDGLYYFHVKALKHGVWGATSHFQLKIDSSPPALFTPKADFILGDTSLKTTVSFFTTDALSGMDHYEIGVIRNSDPSTQSPIFTQVGSPYLLPEGDDDNVRVIVRAVDVAGNVRDATLDIEKPFFVEKFLGDYKVMILALALIASLLLLLGYYLFVHHVLGRVKSLTAPKKVEEKLIEKVEEQEVIPEHPSVTPPPVFVQSEEGF